MSEETKQDVNPMDSLDFSDESEVQEQPVEQETTADDSSTEEAKDPEKTDQSQETEGDKTEESEQEGAEESTEETSEEGESKAKNSAQNRIRSLANENRQLRQQVEALNAQFYEPQTAEQLQEQGLDETQAQIEALRQQQAINQANQHITSLNSDINMESVQVMHDFPIFDPDSKEFNKDFAAMVNQEYMAASGMTTDQNTGLITQARVLPYDFYKSYARTYEMGMKKGSVKGQSDYKKTANAADVTPVASPKEEKEDPLMKALLAD